MPTWNTSRDAVPPGHTQVTVYDEADGQRVATVFRADAVPLIASAPKLAAALRDILNGQIGGNVDHDAERFRNARAALAVAEGGDR